MEITTAKSAGFCFGVKRAVDFVFQLLDEGNKVTTLGPIIHNPQMVEKFRQRGVSVIDDISQFSGEGLLVIRSHGVGKQIYDMIAQKGYRYKDATCPFVAKIHKIVYENTLQNKTIIIMGDAKHPEVQGIVGYCNGNCLVAKTSEELTEKLDALKITEDTAFAMVAQTTFSMQTWEICVEIAKKVCTNLQIFDTICNATALRQEEAVKLARASDLMIVIGGRNSSNTANLKYTCEKYCRTVLIESPSEVFNLKIGEAVKVGITAGASTPAAIIKEVQKNMSELVATTENEEVSFEELLDQSFKSIYTGEKVTGIVTGIKPTEIEVDIGIKYAGYIALSELTDDPNVKPEDIVKVGQELELIVIRVNDVEGRVMLSKKRVDAIAGFEKVMNAAETGEVIEGTVVEVVKGGILVLSGGVKVFIPASLSGVPKGQPLEGLLKQHVSFKVLEVNRGRRRAIGSIKAVQRELQKAKQEQFWAEAEVGKRYEGVVKSLTSFGAFVDLGGVDGLVHISELSWSKIKHASDVVSVGDTISVYIKEIDPETKKISLGYKKAEDNPWEILKNNYQVGSIVNVKIVSLTSFGAFAQIIPGVDGLIHISQIANERVEKVADKLSVGMTVDAKITELDFEKKRVSLSIKALLSEQKEENEEVEA